MKKMRKLSLKEELEKEAAEIEKELENHPESDELKVSKELDDAIYARIQQYEKEQEENKIKELPIRTYKKKRKMKLAVALVAVLVLVMGMSVSSVGSKSYMKELIEKFTGKSQVDVTNVKDMDSKETEDALERAAYQKIEDMIKKRCVHISERPEEMHFVSYNIDENMQQADIFYEYQEKIIRYEIYLNHKDSSKGLTKEDLKEKAYELYVDREKIKVEERKIEENGAESLIANFEYEGVQYQLKGEMKRTEFDKILKNLNFY